MLLISSLILLFSIMGLVISASCMLVRTYRSAARVFFIYSIIFAAIGVFGATMTSPTQIKDKQVGSEETAPAKPTAAELAEQKALDEAKRKAAAEAECLQNNQCFSDKHMPAAKRHCPDMIERLAKNSFEWTDSWSSPKFSHFRVSKDRKIITYVGDRIKYQNSFGAWIIHVYECDIEAATDRAISVRAEPGRVPVPE